MSVGDHVRGALSTDLARRIGWGLLLLLLLFLWLNMVRRVVDGPSGTQYDDFVAFSRDLLFERTNVYATYADTNTIVKYPPFFAFLMAPLVPLPDWLGASVWFWASLTMAVATTWMAVRIADDGTATRPLGRSFYVWPFVAVAGVVGSNLETAQVNLAIWFFAVAGLWLWRERRDAPGGALVGAATALKLTPGIFLAWFLWKRQWAALGWGAVGLAVCWFVLQPIAFGPEFFGTVFRDWIGSVAPFLGQGATAETVSGGFRFTNQSLEAALGRSLADVPTGLDGIGASANVLALDLGTVGLLVRGLQAGLLVALAWLCRSPVDGRDRIGLAFEIGLVATATLWLSPISWINHYVALLPAFAVAVYWVKTRPVAWPERGWLLRAVVVSAVLVASAIARLPQALSLPFVGAVVLFGGIVAAWRRERRATVAGEDPGADDRSGPGAQYG